MRVKQLRRHSNTLIYQIKEQLILINLLRLWLNLDVYSTKKKFKHYLINMIQIEVEGCVMMNSVA